MEYWAMLLFVAIASAGTNAIFKAEFGTVPQIRTPSKNPGPSPSEEFPFYEQLADAYNLHWKFNATHITFEVIVNTAGWVGFGISPKGAMKSSDVVIGWVQEGGQVHFADRHAEDRILPAKDKSQDWTMLMGQEVDDYTVLKMSRLLDTCDENDLPITEGTTRVIFAYSSSDPPSDSEIFYHGIDNRGTKSILLLQPPTYEQENSSLPSDVETLEFVHKNFSVPSSDTTYWCSFWKLPDLGEKRHVIRYEPIMQAEHGSLLHHILLWYCKGGLDEAAIVKDAFHCYSDRQIQANRCSHVFVSWAIGGKAFDFPSHVGYSLGTVDDPTHFMMEVHYDNPSMTSGMVDSSGVRVYLTSQLRQHDAGVLMAGIRVGAHQIIPPYEPNFMSKGFCEEECLAEGLGDKEIYVIANLLHSHLLGVKIRTRHFRKGRELPPIQEDNNYDFDYQETRKLDSERTIKKGDSLLVECEYDSTKRTDVTYGGFTSTEEMCLSLITYYPRNQLSKCSSRLVYDLPALYRNKDIWRNESARENFKLLVASSAHTQICEGDLGPMRTNFKTFSTPKIIQAYTKPSTCQKQDDPNISSKLNVSNVTIIVYFFFLFLHFFSRHH